MPTGSDWSKFDLSHMQSCVSAVWELNGVLSQELWTGMARDTSVLGPLSRGGQVLIVSHAELRLPGCGARALGF